MSSNHNRNPGVPLDLDWVMGAHVNKSAVERRVEPPAETAYRQKGLAGSLAPARRHLH
jgi:hypothetical protein